MTSLECCTEENVINPPQILGTECNTAVGTCLSTQQSEYTIIRRLFKYKSRTNSSKFYLCNRI